MCSQQGALSWLLFPHITVKALQAFTILGIYFATLLLGAREGGFLVVVVLVFLFLLVSPHCSVRGFKV